MKLNKQVLRRLVLEVLDEAGEQLSLPGMASNVVPGNQGGAMDPQQKSERIALLQKQIKLLNDELKALQSSPTLDINKARIPQ
jgi:hypothetical protein